ncbi:hypothetical protein [Pseudoroseomonas ludipueritiae]|uniref:Uncharacterized protein n=1 Tax=Pseudoroseomonas ludipueritiae TaxID=198093 RepID=A0ABR7R7H7_9PROT|nr:hypothetical protein [Pseudoroseomonas ludipueritiae]MBC9177727.1 hypothetical protein [Pseudoroseomonas ludipueritiae]MCG7360593.1 hypothetical protein [Roseomonas sp. ACRSG]
MTRRTALGAGALAGLGALFPRTTFGAVTAAPLPTPGPGELVSLMLEGSGAPAGTVAVFGQAFHPGDLPRGQGLAARRADGGVLTTQHDVVARHPDGSARFAIVSIAQSFALPAGRSSGIVLFTTGEEQPADPQLPADLAARQLLLEVMPQSGGEPWRVDLIALLQAQKPEERDLWQAGPLAWQTRLTLPVPLWAVSGVTSLRLVADVAWHQDGTVGADLWMRNDVSMQPGGGAVAYGLRVVLDGREILQLPELRQAQYTAFGRRVGLASNRRPAPVPPLVRHNVTYLASTGAVARYNLPVGVNASLLEGYARSAGGANWNRPFNPRGITQDMPMTGGRGDIGPTTQPQAAWLMTGDRRAAEYCIGQAEAAGAIPWHHWDAQPGASGWLNVAHWPRLWTDGRGGPPPGGLSQPVTDAGGWTPEGAHQPDLCFVPFLLTGRRAFLDELQAQAAWNIMSHWPDPRGGAEANIVRGQQVRGMAWALRQLHEAAWISPDRDPHRTSFAAQEDRNWAWMAAQLPQWSEMQGEAFGRVLSPYEPLTELRPWQQDFLASTAAAAARKGNPQARAVLAWMSNFLVGRFQSGNQGFNPRDGVAYIIANAGQGQSAPYRNWAEMGRETRARNWSNGKGWQRTEGNYAQTARMALAGIIDVLDTAEAKQAYAWLVGSGAPFTQASDFARDPTFNIVPRGQV